MRLVVLSLLCVLPTALLAETPAPWAHWPLRLTSVGVNCAYTVEHVDPDDGTLRLVPDGRSRRDVETQSVPLRLGLDFGITFTAPPHLTGLTARMQHPPLGAGAVTAQYWSVPDPNGTPQAVGYSLSALDELVPGRWTLSLHRDGRTLAVAAFDLVPAAQVPDICADSP